MSNIFADRVKETTATTGTGTITLAGAAAQFQGFAAAVGNGNTCDYCILSGNGSDWEVGNGTVSTSGGNTLARTTIYASANSGAAISLAGTSTVFLTLSAHSIATFGAGGGSGLFSQVLSATPTQSGTGLSTWLNQPTGATVANVATGLQLYANAASYDLAVLKKTAPTPPYSFTALIALTSSYGNYSGAGIGWSDGTKFQTLRINTANQPQIFNDATYTAFASNPASLYINVNQLWVKIVDDGTDFNFYTGADGASWFPLYSGAKSTGYLSAYSDVVFAVDSRTGATYGTIMSWSQGTS